MMKIEIGNVQNHVEYHTEEEWRNIHCTLPTNITLFPDDFSPLHRSTRRARRWNEAGGWVQSRGHSQGLQPGRLQAALGVCHPVQGYWHRLQKVQQAEQRNLLQVISARVNSRLTLFIHPSNWSRKNDSDQSDGRSSQDDQLNCYFCSSLIYMDCIKIIPKTS